MRALIRRLIVRWLVDDIRRELLKTQRRNGSAWLGR